MIQNDKLPQIISLQTVGTKQFYFFIFLPDVHINNNNSSHCYDVDFSLEHFVFHSETLVNRYFMYKKLASLTNLFKFVSKQWKHAQIYFWNMIKPIHAHFKHHNNHKTACLNRVTEISYKKIVSHKYDDELKCFYILHNLITLSALHVWKMSVADIK